MKKSCVASTDLVCMNCGNIVSIMRKTSRLKEVSHIKDLWCYKCLDVTKHFEVVDVSKFLWRDTNDSMELYVKGLLKNGKNEESNRVFKKILKK